MYRIVTDDKERVGAWVAQKVEQTCAWGPFYAMGTENEQGQLVAGIVMNNYNGANATTHIAVERTGKHLLRLLSAFARYAFVQCGLKRLTGLVPANRGDLLRFYLHIGWEIEHVMRDGDPSGDMVMIVMWPQKCRWLEAK